MRVTRRYRATAALGLVLAVLAVVFARPALLLGAAGVGAWLLARQYQFVRELARVDDALTVDVTVTPARVATEEPATTTLAAALDRETPLSLSVTANPPLAATGSTAAERTLHLDREGATTFSLAVGTAGVVAFEPSTVEARDAAGLFVETLPRGPTPTLTVEPRAPRNVHVGEGGEEVAVAFGEHDAGRLGSGLDPAEIREYVAGDSARRIDWKATARLDHPHVREFEAETDRTTVLVVDHRAPMARGREGQRAFDYAREVALAFVDSARDLDDPVGLYAVGDGGLTGAWPPETGPGQYRTLRRELGAMRPSSGPGSGTATGTGPGTATGARPGRGGRPPAAARSAANRLRGDDTAFGATLRPFFEAADAYVERIGDEPLFGTVRTHLTRLRGTTWTVLVTDDTGRSEVRETVKLARRGDDHVLVFLTPAVLFEPGGLSDLETAYDRYLDFEEFRRGLARLDRVHAFEVGPGDRLGALLASQRAARTRRGAPR